ncbi:hypothetical protein PCE1_002729 [Barthelona sp. PCE]
MKKKNTNKPTELEKTIPFKDWLSHKALPPLVRKNLTTGVSEIQKPLTNLLNTLGSNAVASTALSSTYQFYTGFRSAPNGMRLRHGIHLVKNNTAAGAVKLLSWNALYSISQSVLNEKLPASLHSLTGPISAGVTTGILSLKEGHSSAFESSILTATIVGCINLVNNGIFKGIQMYKHQ